MLVVIGTFVHVYCDVLCLQLDLFLVSAKQLVERADFFAPGK